MQDAVADDAVVSTGAVTLQLLLTYCRTCRSAAGDMSLSPFVQLTPTVAYLSLQDSLLLLTVPHCGQGSILRTFFLGLSQCVLFALAFYLPISYVIGKFQSIIRLKVTSGELEVF